LVWVGAGAPQQPDDDPKQRAGYRALSDDVGDVGADVDAEHDRRPGYFK
jgi:hypothetical protein